ncbi:thioredoxin domain-containing protein [Cellulomonas sp. APG4]|uniref:DsbA family protein n=1 Tax=Cellulomonas sp. APG4 TaxID=1538656 RepID=UPI001379C327|nr:thioredoxin domain-containing protein [Cellulomonas sp. APG4]NCT92239.1 thioredoxin domain-containing protein [Cellulomonas sp. APG4]
MPDRRTSPRTWLVPAVVLLVAGGLVLAALERDRGAAEPAVAPPTAAGTPTADAPAADGPVGEVAEPGADALEVARRDPADPTAAGPVDAPVVLVAFSDYQCPFCARWVHETQPALEPYVEAGDLRIEWRDVNVYGEDSRRGARAAYAAGLQGGFWEFHDALFADGEKPSPAELGEESLRSLADGLGLDVDRFTRDLASAEVARGVQENEDLGLTVGAFSTPSFLIGDQPVVGAQPTDVFVEAVEQALAQAQG